MIKMIKLTITAAILICMVALVGCGSNTGKTPTTVQPNDGSQPSTEDAQAITQLATNFAYAVSTRSYQKLGDCRQEYQYYTEEFSKQLLSQKADANTIKYFTDNQIVSQDNGIKNVKIIKSSGPAQYEISFTDEKTFISASASFLAKNNLKQQVVYGQPVKLKVVQANNTWKILSTEISDQLVPQSTDSSTKPSQKS